MLLLGRNSKLMVPEGSTYLEIPSREIVLKAFRYDNLKIQLQVINLQKCQI